MQVLVLDVFQGLFVRRHALEPTERRHHGQQQMQLGVFGHEGLLKDGAVRMLFGIKAACQVIGRNLNHILRNSGRLRVVARQRMPIRNKVEAFVGGFLAGARHPLILQPHPVRQRAKVIADVHPSGRPHAAQDARLLQLDAAISRPFRLLLHSMLPTPGFSDTQAKKRDPSLGSG